MKRFIVLSHVPAEVMAQMSKQSPGEVQSGMKAWFDWKASYPTQVEDMGAPIVNSVKVNADGSRGPSTKDTAGYMIITAINLDEAIKLLQASPLFEGMEGCSIELHELMSMV